jgi:hypothetical protein
MERIRLEFGMRVRCVDPADFEGVFTPGFEGKIKYTCEGGNWVGFAEDRGPVWRADRFKPVIRVRAGRG